MIFMEFATFALFAMQLD